MPTPDGYLLSEARGSGSLGGRNEALGGFCPLVRRPVAKAAMRSREAGRTNAYMLEPSEQLRVHELGILRAIIRPAISLDSKCVSPAPLSPPLGEPQGSFRMQAGAGEALGNNWPGENAIVADRQHSSRPSEIRHVETRESLSQRYEVDRLLIAIREGKRREDLEGPRFAVFTRPKASDWLSHRIFHFVSR
jgi:hypothetical protein